MTAPLALPLMNEPLITKNRLAVWAKRPIESDDDILFADEVIAAVSILIRTYGDPYWTIEITPIYFPDRADTIAMTTAKNYYLNSKLLVADTVGPLSERYKEEYVNNITLTEDQKAELAVLAGRDPGEAGSGTGLWVLGTEVSYSRVATSLRTETPRYWP